MWPPLLLLDPESAASALKYRFNRIPGTCGLAMRAYRERRPRMCEPMLWTHTANRATGAGQKKIRRTRAHDQTRAG